MTNADDLVRVADILKKLDAEGVCGWYPSEREIQVKPETLRRLFPGSEYIVENKQGWEPYIGVSVKYNGVTFLALVTRERWDELLTKRTLSDEIVDYVRKMDDLTQQAEQEAREC